MMAEGGPEAGSQSTIADKSTEDFAGRMTDTLLSGFTSLFLSIGVELGLFDVLSSVEDTLTAAQLADGAGCKERYVKEWLNQMVTADIVTVDSSGTQFALPHSHREVFRSSGTFFSVLVRLLPYAAHPHTQLLECFKKDGPLGLSFGEVRGSLDAIYKGCGPAHLIVDNIIDIVPEFKQALDRGCSVCDVGSGIGDVSLALVKMFPGISFTGIDLCEDYINQCQTSAQDQQLHHATFLIQDICNLPADWTETFDCMYIRHVLHDLSYTSKAVVEITRCLKRDGLLLVIETNVDSNLAEAMKDPDQKMLMKAYTMTSLYHCLPASMINPGSDALGACAGVQCHVDIITSSGLKVKAVRKMKDEVFILCSKN